MRSIFYTDYPKFMRDQTNLKELKEAINNQLSKFMIKSNNHKKDIIDVFKEENKDLIVHYKNLKKKIEEENPHYKIFISKAKNILSTESSELIFNTLTNPFLNDNHNYFQDYEGTRDWYEYN